MTNTVSDRFRDITGLSASQYSDSDITSKAEVYAIATYYEIMEETLTLTDDTTSNAFSDEILAYLAASFAYRYLYNKRLWMDKKTSDMFEQDALKLMSMRDWSKIAYDERSDRYYNRHTKRGHAPNVISVGVVS